MTAPPGTPSSGCETPDEARNRIDAEHHVDLRHSALLAAALFLSFGGGGATLLWLALHGGSAPQSDVEVARMWPAVFLLVAAVVTPCTVLLSLKTRTREAQMRERETEQLNATVADISDQTLGRLISFNFQLMNRFIGVALSQARAAFAFCVIAASVALMVLLGGTSVVLVAAATGTQVAVAVLTAVGTSLSGFVAHTFQRQYSAATRQMNFYYGQPLVHCYLLHAEWLAQRDVREEKNKLVDATLEAGREAQVHLLDLLRKHPRETPSSAAHRPTNGALSAVSGQFNPTPDPRL